MMKAWTILCCSVGLAIAQANLQFNPNRYASRDVLRRDVVVIGGGASGTYGAIRLLDLGKSVAVVERESTFGGHVSTYREPANGTAIDYGVQAYFNNTVAVDFFARFDVPIAPFGDSTTQMLFKDFKSGQAVQPRQSIDFSAYAAQLSRYPNPQYGFNLPDPVPEDLVLPFRDFVAKYSLQDLAYLIAAFSTGDGNDLDLLTLYVFQRFGHVGITELTQGNGFYTARRNNSELYFKARAELGDSALVSSTVIAAYRPRNRTDKVRLVVRTPTGNKLIIASQILVSIPLTLGNMNPFGLDRHESGLFAQFDATAYYSCLVGNTGLPAGFSYQNAGANTTYNVPDLPTPYFVNPSSQPGYFQVLYGAQTPNPDSQVQADIIASIQRLSNSTATPEILAFSNHYPYRLTVPPQAIRDGFYSDLSALQGYRNTWYTGLLFDESGSSSLWNFTRQLVPSIVTALDG
jgi:hypothetical protein